MIVTHNETATSENILPDVAWACVSVAMISMVVFVLMMSMVARAYSPGAIVHEVAGGAASA